MRRRKECSIIAMAFMCAACGGLVRAEADGGPGSESADDAASPGEMGSSSGVSQGGSSSSSGSAHGGSSSSGASSSGVGGSSSSGSSSGTVTGGSSSGAYSLACMGGDCTGKQVCCASVSFGAGLTVTSACAKAPCATGDYQFCTSSSECTTGTCGANPVGMGPMICSTGGGGGILGGH